MLEDDEVEVLLFEDAMMRVNPDLKWTNVVNGEEALRFMDERIHDKHPLVVVTDINMPRMNGFEFLHALRAHEHFKHTIVFVYTTSNSEHDCKRAYEAGISGYFVKPEDTEFFGRFVEFLNHYLHLVHFPS